MKRILSVLLAVLILCSVFVMPASAESQSGSNKYTDKFEQYLRDLGYPWGGDDERWYGYAELFEYYSENNTSSTPDWVLVSGSTIMVSPAGHDAVYGDYYISVVSGSVPASIPYYIYLPEKNQFYTLNVAWTERFEGIEKAFTEYLVPNNIAKFVEDTDGDGVITQVDAKKAIRGVKVYNSFEMDAKNIYFDTTDCGWGDFEKVYCTFEKKDGTYIYEGKTKYTECTNYDGDSVFRYDMSNIISYFDTNAMLKMTFSNEYGSKTKELYIVKDNLGDIAYCTGVYANEDCTKPVIEWTKKADFEIPALKSVAEELKYMEEVVNGDIETNRYYFLMPNGKNGRRGNDPEGKNYNEFAPSWFNNYTKSAGIYWWYAEYFKPNSWPGYAMEKTSESDVFYADVPKDVETLMFNNTIDAGYFEDSPLVELEGYTDDVIAYGYEPGENELYPDGIESFDNMIFVIDPSYQSYNATVEALRACNGDWYYYYGDGCYGTVKDGKTADCIRGDHEHTFNYLHFDANTTDWEDYSKVYCHIWEAEGDMFHEWQSKKELCEDEDGDGIWSYNLNKAGIYLYEGKEYGVIFSNERGEQIYHLELNSKNVGGTVQLSGRFAETESGTLYNIPMWKSTVLHFDANTTDWDEYKKVYCHIWEVGGDSFFNWQAKKEQCRDDDKDGIWTYDLASKGIELDASKQYVVIFSNENGLQTYNLLFDTTVLGDTAYVDGKFDPNEDDIKLYRAYWRNQDEKEFGPLMRINSIGQVTGSCIPKGLTKEDMFKDFLENYLVDAQIYSGKTDQQLLDDLAKELNLTGNDVERALKEVGITDIEWVNYDSIPTDELDVNTVVENYRKNSGDKFKTKRYYFLMPNIIPTYTPETPPEDREEAWTWDNQYTENVYIYWDGTDRLDLEGMGSKAMKGDTYNIFYADVPDFVTTIHWNNGVKVRENNINDPMLPYAHRTENIMCEYYDAGESETYPDGLDSFENMIFVLERGAQSFGNPVPYEKGEWYYYYGDECYGTEENGGTNDCLNPYHHHKPQDTYIVAGVEKLCGSSWDVYDTNNKMTYNEKTGAYEITYENVPVGNHEFMVTKNHQFGPLTPGNPDYNEAKVTVDGSTVKITYTEGVGVDVKVTAPLLGDVDLDGVISIMDATEIQLAVAKKKTLTAEQEKLADTDHDSKVSIMDATAIQLFVAKKITEF